MKKEKLKSIKTMAKKGTEYEKKNAIKILKKLCKKHDLIFEELMEEKENPQEFSFKFKGKVPKIIAQQIYFKMIGGNYVRISPHYIFLKTTKKKYIAFENAFLIYQRTYKKEQKKFAERQKKERGIFKKAFIQKHNLFSCVTQKEKEEREKRAEKLTNKEIEEIQLSIKLAEEMEEEVSIFKQLND